MVGLPDHRGCCSPLRLVSKSGNRTDDLNELLLVGDSCCGIADLDRSLHLGALEKDRLCLESAQAAEQNGALAIFLCTNADSASRIRCFPLYFRCLLSTFLF